MPENLKPRQSAVRILSRVLSQGQTIDSAISAEKDYPTYTDSDRHFIKLLLLTTLRHLGQIDALLTRHLKKPVPPKQQIILLILRLSLAQGLFLKTPSYAVVHTAVALTRRFHREGLTGFVNGLLRHIFRLQDPLSDLENNELNIPDWLLRSWTQSYGPDMTRKIADSVVIPPALDISVLKDSDVWTTRWSGQLLPTGSIRVSTTSPEDLTDFHKVGWVQNASASIPAQLFTDVAGKKVADLCAAPGGKTLQLAALGANVTAVDISENRLQRLSDNVSRLNLQDRVSIMACDILDLPENELFDAVLLDAPCSATGTLARHPELKYHRTPDDIERLSALQKELLAKAVRLTKPNGEIVFSTCSLQDPEGDSVVSAVLDAATVIPTQISWLKSYLTPFGSLRIFPFDGYDGFYVCHLRKNIR